MKAILRYSIPGDLSLSFRLPISFLTFITDPGHNHTTMDLLHTMTFTLTIPEPFDFTLTVAKPAGWPWSTPKEIFGNGTLWTGVRIGDTPIGLVMKAKKNRVTVLAYTLSPLTKEEEADLRGLVVAGLGADEDLRGFYEFAHNDPVLEKATADHPGMRIGLLDDVFGGVILAILLQMAPIGRSEQMMDMVLEPLRYQDLV